MLMPIRVSVFVFYVSTIINAEFIKSFSKKRGYIEVREGFILDTSTNVKTAFSVWFVDFPTSSWLWHKINGVLSGDWFQVVTNILIFGKESKTRC